MRPRAAEISGAQTAPDARVRASFDFAQDRLRAYVGVLSDIQKYQSEKVQRRSLSFWIMNGEERLRRESKLVETIRKELPQFINACAADTGVVLIHQDAFAADYQDDEYSLLGMVIKYAGLQGKEARVIGKNRGTLGQEERVQ